MPLIFLTKFSRGMGESTESSPKRTDVITLEVMARDLVAIIQHLGWMEVDILGFSMGGKALTFLITSILLTELI